MFLSSNGNRVFNPALISQSEEIMMDYAFRIAVLSTCAENSDVVPSIVLEAPDEIVDLSYLQSLAKAINETSTNLSIVITTLSPDFLGYLVKNYDIKGKDKARLTSLLSPEGTLNQRKYFSSKISKYFSENE